MPPPITIVPLGTASAVPSKTRNHSSLAIIFPSSNTLLVDVGEGTQHQLQKIKLLSPSKISKIFITHLHGDHLFGLCPLLSSLCNGHGGITEGEEDPRLIGIGESPPGKANIEVFGPKGIREYIRTTLRLTYTYLGSWIQINELLFPHEEAEETSAHTRYEKEIPGRSIHQDKEGFWRDIAQTGEFSISAGEIKHSVPCLGYVITESSVPGKIPKEYPKILDSHRDYFCSKGYPEPRALLSSLQSNQIIDESQSTILSSKGIHLPDNTILPRPTPRPGRKITILGDTYDPSPLTALAQNSTVLIHEATNAHLPGIDPDTKSTDTYDSMRARTMSRGHSTPEMAGLFARNINLGVTQDGREVGGTLILNHFSSRYKDDEAEGPDGEAMKIMRAIKWCAENAWSNGLEGSGIEGFNGAASACANNKRRVICARDGVKVEIKISE